MLYSNTEMNALQFVRQCYCRGFIIRASCPANELCIQKKSDTLRISSCLIDQDQISAVQVDNLILPREHVKHWLSQPYAAELLHQKMNINVAPKDRRRDRRNKAVSLKNTSRARNPERTGEVWKNPLFLFAAISNPALLTAITLTTSIIVMRMVTKDEDYTEPQRITTAAAALI